MPSSAPNLLGTPAPPVKNVAALPPVFFFLVRCATVSACTSGCGAGTVALVTGCTGAGAGCVIMIGLGAGIEGEDEGITISP